MSTIAYNEGNLQSCLESHIIETTLTLTLSSPRCIDLGGWSFLQNLSNTSKDFLEKEKPTYIHPLAKQSFFCSTLSEKSLKFCTENLGSETGTDIAEGAIFSSDPLLESTLTNQQERVVPPLPRRVQSRNHNKVKYKSRNFPPPLTTISGANSLRVRSHREGGRLVIKAGEAPPKHAYLQAERSHGRLRLSFLDDPFTRFDSDITDDEENIRIEEFDGEVDDIESDINVEDVEEEEAGENDVHEERDMDGNVLDAEVEMGIEKYQRLRRCMESGHRNKALCDWKPLCVATS